MKFFRYLLCMSLGLFLPANTAVLLAASTGADEPVQAEIDESARQDKSIADYLYQIARQEKTHGAFDSQLGEQLLGLGLLYRNMGQNDKASEILSRSLQIKRVNEGLQTMAQVPTLEALIDVNAAAGNWKELDANYQLLLWVHQRNHEPGDPEMLAIYNRVGKWKLRVLDDNLLEDVTERTVSDLSDMYESMLMVMEKLYGEKDPRLVEPLRIRAMTGYQLARMTLATPLNNFEGTGGTAVRFQVVCREKITAWGVQRICSNVAVDNPEYYTSKQAEQTNTIMMYVYQAGKALRQIAEIQNFNLSASNYDRARAFVDLGDWYFINTKRTAAFKAYKSAFEFLQMNGSKPGDIALLFGNPVLLPVMNIDTGKTASRQEDDKTYVTLSFDVTVRGRARNIHVVDESDPENLQARVNAKKIISSSLFRPRILGGDPVPTENTVLRLSGSDVEHGPDQTLTGFIRNRDYNSLKSRIIE